jgi:hypothetical protein
LYIVRRKNVLRIHQLLATNRANLHIGVVE